MPRPCRQLAVAHRPKLAAQRLLRHCDPEFLPHPLAQVDDPPSHHTVHREDRAVLHHRHQCRTVRSTQPRRLTRRLAIHQTLRAASVETQHAVAHHLQRDPAGLRRLRPATPVINRCQRQQTPNLAGMLAVPRKLPKPPRIIVQPQANRMSHGELPPCSPHRIRSAPRRGIPQ